MATNPVFELVLRETGLWAILHRTGRTANVVETGQVDRQIAALDLASYATSRTLSPIGQGWLKVADRLAYNMKQGRNRKASRTHEPMSRADVLRLLQAHDYRCAVSGSYFTHDCFDGRPRDPFQPSIDCRDPAVGYTRDNVRIVCLLVNMAMADWGEEPLRKIAERISRPVLRPDNALLPVVAQKRLRLTSCEITAYEQCMACGDDTDTVSHSPVRRAAGYRASLENQGKS